MLLGRSASVPDSLKHNQAPSNSVGSDLHHVDLADNLKNTDSGPVTELGKRLPPSAPSQKPFVMINGTYPCGGRPGEVEEEASLNLQRLFWTHER
jgi:hypothetical protein